MEILSISLKNFKSHSDRHFTFQPGTNAICGENGAGKTSLLEAIAWTLFNYRGAYKTEDLIRDGTAHAQVRIAFISSRDGRTYEISRCTRTGYIIYDPQLGAKLDYSRIEEVMKWLREHLGVVPNTDLPRLFASMIGIPQGTFTLDFLQPAEKRKPIFDSILKVEEYRQTTQQMLSLEKYAKAEVEKLEAAIAQYQETLKDWESLNTKRQHLDQERQQVESELQHWQHQLQHLQTELEQLNIQAAALQQLTTQIDKLTAQQQAQTQLLSRLQLELQQAEAAVTICREHRPDYQAFLNMEDILQDLEQHRQQQQTLLEQRQAHRDTLSDRQAELSRLTDQRDRLLTARADLQKLEPLLQQQQALEQQQQLLNQQLQVCQSWRQTRQRETTRLSKVQSRLAQLNQEIEGLRSLCATDQQIAELEAQQQRYQHQLSRMTATTELSAELQQLLSQAQAQGESHATDLQAAMQTLQDLQQAIPLWATTIATIQATLERGSGLHGQFIQGLSNLLQALITPTTAETIHQQLQQIQSQLQVSRQQQARFLTLPSKLTEQQSIREEMADIQATLEQAQAHLVAEPDLQKQQQQLAQALAQLDNPKGRQQLLAAELSAQPQLEAHINNAQQAVSEVQTAIAQIETQLAAFTTLSEQIQSYQQQREQYRPAYQVYWQHRDLANSYNERYQLVQTAQTQLQDWEQTLQELQEQRHCLSATYDPAQLQAVQTAHQTAHTQQIRLSARLPEMVKRLADLDQQLSELQTVQAKCTQAINDLKHKQKIERFVKFARKVYKEAGPRITERYVHSISREADRLFRELLNRPNVSLEWTRDYEILIREGGHSRRFMNLSGGEQMCAALAVRLALLKVLADIDIAFFDEPTTNMDRLRREQLAEAIARIRSFRQLFVISHDDTFEKVTENVIVVEREA
jgi:exonuclease SbcC